MKKLHARTQAEWTLFAERKLRAALKAAQMHRSLVARIPQARNPQALWTASLRLVGAKVMTRLNSQFRGKAYPTDVLSFQAPELFQAEGHLGELLICLPVLKKQARALGHAPEKELQILLVHGVLHLLGMDHEEGRSQAAKMAQWETRLLPESFRSLIARSGDQD